MTELRRAVPPLIFELESSNKDQIVALEKSYLGPFLSFLIFLAVIEIFQNLRQKYPFLAKIERFRKLRRAISRLIFKLESSFKDWIVAN